MQSPDQQQPAEEQNNRPLPGSELEAASFQPPLYEFPPNAFLPEHRPNPAIKMPPFVSPMLPQPPVKKSRKWLWIVLSTFAVVLIGSCSLCGWAAYAFFNTTYQQVSGSLKVVNDFYSNIQGQNYSAAYSDLSPQDSINSLTQEQFLQQAQARDTRYGPVLSFTLNQPSYTIDPNTNQPNLSHLTITVQVKRAHLSYAALLSVRNINGIWKITDFDAL